MRAKVAHSEDPSTDHAVDEILATLGGEAPAALLVFSAMVFDHHRVLARLVEAFPGVPLLGCTTDGELSSARGFEEDSLAVLALYDVRARVGKGAPLANGMEQAVREALSVVDGPGVVIALPPGVASSGTKVVDAIHRHLPPGNQVFGGTGADQWNFACSYQFAGAEVAEDLLPVLWLEGVQAEFGIESGWSPAGPTGVVTEAVENVVHRIDGEPALTFFRRHFGEQHEPIPEFPLAMGDDRLCLRAPLNYDAESGSVYFAASVPVGARVRIAVAERRAIIQGSRRSVEMALATGEPQVLLFFSCAARKHVLGTQTGEELVVLQERVPDVPFIGFYGYGEFMVGDAHTGFHNETLVSVALRSGG